VLPRLIPPLVHRLNNSLAVLRGVCDLSEGQRGRRADAPELELARRETRRAGDLLRHLSAFAKEHEPTSALFDLRALVQGSVALLAPLAEESGVQLDASEEGESVIVRSDPARLEQLVIAIVARALVGARGRAGHGHARIGLERRTECAELDLSWSGLGEGDPGRDAELVGELAALVGADGGRVRSGHNDEGQRIRIQLPLARRDELPPLTRASEPIPAARILLVEDDVVLCELVETVLREAGYRVRSAGGAAAGAVLAAKGFDLVLLDLDLARGDQALVDELERVAPATRVALFGGAPGPTPGEHLAKPFRPGDLLDYVRTQLARASRT
jgi:CheY-like chemotaxis protein